MNEILLEADLLLDNVVRTEIDMVNLREENKKLLSKITEAKEQEDDIYSAIVGAYNSRLEVVLNTLWGLSIHQTTFELVKKQKDLIPTLLMILKTDRTFEILKPTLGILGNFCINKNICLSIGIDTYNAIINNEDVLDERLGFELALYLFNLSIYDKNSLQMPCDMFFKVISHLLNNESTCESSSKTFINVFKANQNRGLAINFIKGFSSVSKHPKFIGSVSKEIQSLIKKIEF